MMISETFKALGDPVRLEMIRRLSDDTRHTINSVSQKIGVTRQGARKHLQILVDVGLVFLKTEGRSTEVSLNRDSLLQAKAFIATLERQWDARLEGLKSFVENNG